MANVLIFRLFLGTLQVHSSVALGALEHNRHYPLQLTDMHLMRNRCERRTATGSAASCVALTRSVRWRRFFPPLSYMLFPLTRPSMHHEKLL